MIVLKGSPALQRMEVLMLDEVIMSLSFLLFERVESERLPIAPCKTASQNGLSFFPSLTVRGLGGCPCHPYSKLPLPIVQLDIRLDFDWAILIPACALICVLKLLSFAASNRVLPPCI